MTDNQKIDQHIKDKYKVIKKLGSGAYGHVSKVSPIDRPTQIYALKKVFEAFQHDTDAQRTYRQISILKKIEHPNIIKLYQVLPSVSGRDIYLVFEFMATDLYKVIYQNNLQEVHIKFIMYQLLKGLNYLHSANLLHRDLKPSNLLLSPQCNLKICDFGLARHLNNEAGEQNVLTEGVATRWYRAPEVLLGSNSYDEKADLWSAGCILAEMILRNPLFNCNSTTAQFEKILQVVGRPSMEQIKQTNYEIANTLIKQLGQIRQKSSKQIFGHQNELCIDLIYKLLKFSPSKRISAKQAMMHPYLKDFFREQDLVGFKGQIKMQADQNVKLTTDKYKELISKHFILSKQTKKQEPQRFSDLKREKSFGKIIEQIHYRKSSGQKDIKQKPIHKNTHLFEYLLKQREASGGKVRVKSSSGSHYPQPNKQNLNMNKEPFLEKFSQQNKAIKPNGTFAALKKVTALKFNR